MEANLALSFNWLFEKKSREGWLRNEKKKKSTIFIYESFHESRRLKIAYIY